MNCATQRLFAEDTDHPELAFAIASSFYKDSYKRHVGSINRMLNFF